MVKDEAISRKDMIKNLVVARRERIIAHENYRKSEPYIAAISRIDSLVTDYGLVSSAIDLMATRCSSFHNRLITLRVKQQLVESLVSIAGAIKEGHYNPARRELRFLLEASVKTLWLDSGCPPIGDTDATKPLPISVDEKVASLDDLGRERFGKVVASLKFRLMDESGTLAYQQRTNSLYSLLSTHVHISTGMVERDVKSFDRGSGIGFESISELNTMVDLVRQVLDVALASHFEAFDGELVGDIFTSVLDRREGWSFRKTPLVSAVSRHFNYKFERSEK